MSPVALFGAALGVSALAGVVSWQLTRWLLRYTRSTGMIDVPGARSSHRVPTPRGGGLAIIAVFYMALALLTLLWPDVWPLSTALLAGLVIAGLGWLDDKVDLSARARMGLHIVAALWAMGWLGVAAPFSQPVTVFLVGGVVLVTILWLTNLYNFMDGIDGLAGTQTLMVASGAALSLLLNAQLPLALLCAALAGAAAGFLRLNWQPARIFMGDVGSATLGFIFAVLGLYTVLNNLVPLGVWLLLLAPFIVDATATLVRRILKRERWTQAHRKHAYQRATQLGYSHRRVTLSVGLIDVVLVLVAVFFGREPLVLWPLLVLVTACLLWLWRRYTYLFDKPASSPLERPVNP